MICSVFFKVVFVYVSCIVSEYCLVTRYPPFHSCCSIQFVKEASLLLMELASIQPDVPFLNKPDILLIIAQSV